ncbi:hypothetical protein EVAR_103550_1 [Eumeta japonica]|uniref:Uncharacterized protein n=1 Tax=Eumeta variegata TaxID=151549 RepID=A0A4C1YF23_EUMVA|nr:hypothetical protein EVAR_103550_1 [Eumeta japonica]
MCSPSTLKKSQRSAPRALSRSLTHQTLHALTSPPRIILSLSSFEPTYHTRSKFGLTGMSPLKYTDTMPILQFPAFITAALWAKEREARSILMQEVLSALQHQVEEKIEMNRQRQKENVLEREQILNQVEDFHQEVRAKERETHHQNLEYSNINLLQSELNKLKVQKEQLDEKKAMEASLRESIAQEEKLRKELVKIHREGVSDLPTRRKVAW